LIRIQEARTIPLPRHEAFEFVADFTHVEEWDPGITASAKIGNDEVGVGTQFAVESNFAGRSLPLTYTVEEWDAPERAVLYTETSRFSGRDTITFHEVAEGTAIDYVAEFQFKGVMRFIEPLLRPTFRKIGVEATDGIVAAAAQRVR